jgi:hypothetical protein
MTPGYLPKPPAELADDDLLLGADVGVSAY